MSHSHQAPVMQGRLDLSNCNMQSQKSLLVGFTQAGVGPGAGHRIGERREPRARHTCCICQPVGSKNYARQGDLTRHIKTVHGTPSRFLCHIHQCPRSILGGGFPRKDKLVDHLKSSKPGHGLSHQEAVYQATLHNMSHLHVVPQAPSVNFSTEDDGPWTTSLGVSHEEWVQQASLNSAIPEGTSEQDVLHSTRYEDAADYAVWDGASGHNTDRPPVVHNSAYTNAPQHGYSVNVFPQDFIQQNAFDNMSNANAMDQGAFENTFHESAVDQATFNRTFDAEVHPTWH